MAKNYIYVDPYERHWTKEELDKAMTLFHSFKENLSEIIEYY